MYSNITQLQQLQSILNHQLSNAVPQTPLKNEGVNYTSKYYVGGVVYPGQSVDFQFKPKLNETFEIKLVKPGCGCTTHTLDNSKVIKGQIKVEDQISGSNRFVQRTKGITITYADGTKEILQVAFIIDKYGKL